MFSQGSSTPVHPEKDVDRIELRRNPTLESQHDAVPQRRRFHWRTWSFSRTEEAEDDPVQSALKSDIAERRNAPVAERLLRDYLRFRRRPGSAVVHHVLRYWSLPPPMVKCWRAECSDPRSTQCKDPLILMRFSATKLRRSRRVLRRG